MTDASDSRREPSPFVRIYIVRGQAEAIERVLAEAAEGKSSRHVLQAALKRVREALAENG